MTTLRFLVSRGGLSALALVSAPVFAECPTADAPVSGLLAGDGHAVAWRTVPDPVVVNEFFDVEATVCRTDGVPFDGDLRIDADMPAHGHGMNYVPEIEAIGGGGFVARGFLFHMPGEWRFRFTIDEDGQRVRLDAPHAVR